jgi:hypothetical protein
MDSHKTHSKDSTTKKFSDADILKVVENLRDLDKISKQLHAEFKNKNLILADGLEKCKMCEKLVKK